MHLGTRLQSEIDLKCTSFRLLVKYLIAYLRIKTTFYGQQIQISIYVYILQRFVYDWCHCR